MKRGYEVYAMDVTTEMVFDGIWTCASLLHVPRQDIVRIIRKYAGMIKPGGVFNMSFRLRPDDHESGGSVLR